MIDPLAEHLLGQDAFTLRAHGGLQTPHGIGLVASMRVLARCFAEHGTRLFVRAFGVAEVAAGGMALATQAT